MEAASTGVQMHTGQISRRKKGSHAEYSTEQAVKGRSVQQPRRRGGPNRGRWRGSDIELSIAMQQSSIFTSRRALHCIVLCRCKCHLTSSLLCSGYIQYCFSSSPLHFAWAWLQRLRLIAGAKAAAEVGREVQNPMVSSSMYTDCANACCCSATDRLRACERKQASTRCYD